MLSKKNRSDKSIGKGLGTFKLAALCTVCAGAGSVVVTEQAEANVLSDTNFRYGGYVRAWSSFNLENQPDVEGRTRGKPSMLRGSVSLWAEMDTGPIAWRAVGRADREKLTSYEKDLQSAARINSPDGPGSDMVDIYNKEELRELHADFTIGRTFFRLGKQLVVWGETDFFHPTDLIHGHDFQWRSFVEPEADELKKPRILANAMIDVPELDGSLQVVIIPGLDKKRDIGNTTMLSGGRWMPQPFKGVDFTAANTLYDFEHPDGDYQDVTGGFRWTGYLGSTNYAASWLRVQHPDAVLNPAAAPYKKAPKGLMGDWFYPEVDVFAASISKEIMAIDSVVNVELAFHKDRLFNSGITHAVANVSGAIGPIVEKDVVATTIRIDKQLRLMNLLGTNAPSFTSLQIFDTWIQDFKKSDQIVEAVGYGEGKREHTTIATYSINFPYMNSRLVPGVAVGHYFQHGDSFMIPSIDYSLGNHWRFRAEANLFFAKNTRDDFDSPANTDTGGLGALNRNDQLVLRATYQF